MKPRKNEPLIRYLRVQEAWERDLLYVLNRSAADAARMLKDLAGRDGIGAKIRSDQLKMVQREMKKQQADLWRTIGGSVKAAQLDAASAAIETGFMYKDMLLRSAFSAADIETMMESAVAQARRGLENTLSRMNGLSHVPLSERVYGTQALANQWVDRKIEHALATGKSWKELADDVRGFIRPDTPGGVSYAAKRLGRTELNNAFHATAVRQGIDDPYIVGQRWNLSGSHPKPDECNDYADDVHYEGGEPGVYEPNAVPAKPHPQCLCYITPEVMDEDTFIAQLTAGDIVATPTPDWTPMSLSMQDRLASSMPRATDAVMPSDMYRATAYRPVNSLLRTGKAEFLEEADMTAAEVKQLMYDMSMEWSDRSVRVPNDMSVFRGVADIPDSWVEGATIVDAAFVSTTANIRVAEQFARADGWIVETLVQARGRVFPVKNDGILAESEIILQRNRQFDVVKIDREKKRVWLKLVPR